ncbi:MAG: hypothetical protein ACJ79H_05285 [Myxococcales bacterium]
MTIVLLALGCMSLAFLLFQRARGGEPGALARLALLHGVERIRGESEVSLRNRTAGAARWPYSRPQPQFVWWARAWHRMTGAPRRA